jgi:hypothetical protein
VQIPRWFYPLALFALARSLGLCADPPEPAYRGGALVVTDPGLAQGHLAPGQVLPIRLARLARPEPRGLPALQGAEVPGSVRYGHLVFQQVSPLAVTFVAVLAGAPARTFTLRQGEGADLAGDGLDDVMLRAPVQALAAGARAIDYALLAFQCDARHTAMFALAPGAFQGGRYPYGISGVTPAGQLIFQSDCMEPVGDRHPGRASFAVPESPLVQPGPGDVLVETDSGRVERIARVDRSARRMDIRFAAPGTLRFIEVFGAACVHVSGNLAEMARGRRRGPGKPAEDTFDLLDRNATVNLMDGPNGRLDLQVAARLGVDLSLTGSVDFYGVSVQQSTCLDESLRLAASYRAGRPWSQQLGPLSLDSVVVGFTVNGVPLSFELGLAVGLDLDDKATGSALQGVCCTGRWGWSTAFAATWDWWGGFAVNAPQPVTTHDLALAPLPGAWSRLDGAASVRPWLKLTPRLGFGACFNGEIPCTVDATWSVLGVGDTLQTRLDASWAVAAGLDLELPLLGQVWERTWPLDSGSETLLTASSATAP